MIKGIIDRNACMAAALAGWMPRFFEENPDDNFSQVIVRYRTGGVGEGEAPDNMVDCITQACLDCLVSDPYLLRRIGNFA